MVVLALVGARPAAAERRWMGTIGFAVPLNVEIGGVHHQRSRPVDLGVRARFGSDGAAFEGVVRTWRGPVGLVLAAGVGSHGNSGVTSAQGVTGAVGLEVGGVLDYRLINLYVEARSVLAWENEPRDRVILAVGARAYL